MSSRQCWWPNESKGLYGFAEAEFFVCGLECFTKDWPKSVGNFSLAVLEIGNVLDKSLAATGRKIFFQAESTGSPF